MQHVRLLMVALLFGTALAGCAGSNGSDGANGDLLSGGNLGGEDVDVQATATTGVIRGVVVDASITPVAGAKVAVKTGDKTLQANTTAGGAFGFQGLDPGTYFVKVSKPGFLDVQHSVDVAAGVSEPPRLKVRLETDGNFRKPYVSVIKYDGFVECTSSNLVLCGIPNLASCWVGTCQNITNDRFTWDQYFSDNASHVQAEMFWESNQAASPALYFEMEALDDGCKPTGFLNNTRGTSPIYSTVNATIVEKYSLGTICPIYFSIFSGDAVAAAAGGTNPTCDIPTGLPPPAPGVFPCARPGVTFEQPFTMIIHTFYGWTPDAGWRFSTDGTPVPPA